MTLVDKTKCFSCSVTSNHTSVFEAVSGNSSIQLQHRGREFVPVPVSHTKFMSQKGFALGRGSATDPRMHQTVRDQVLGEDGEMEAEDGEGQRRYHQLTRAMSGSPQSRSDHC